MACESCGDKPKNTSKDFTKAVIEINNPETLVLLRKVVIPVSMGTEEQISPAIGKYHNVILYYEANKHTYLYSSDGIPTFLETEVPQEIWDKIQNLETGLTKEIKDRGDADNVLQGNIDAEAKTRGDADIALDGRLTTVEGIAATALQPEAINKVVMTDISLNANSSTTTVQIDGAKENLLTGAQTTKNLPLPVASHDEAGVMNSSTFDAVTNNTSNINALMNGAVAITGLSASPSQSDLTTAWETETGLTSLMNRAGIYDVDNNKVWTYYSNTSTWYAASNTSQVTINTFTNSSEGTIKGSTNVGQIFAENDGTGSVNGWDTLSGNVASLQSNKQDKLTAGANITISDQNVISAATANYTAGNAITIDPSDNNRIDAAVYPADFFTAGATVEGEGSSITLDKTISAPLKSVELKGDTFQQTYSGKNLFSGDYAQFDNTGGSGDVYAYFELPTNATYTMSLIAKHDFTPSYAYYLGFSAEGGQATGGYKWAFQGQTTAITKGTVYSVSNYLNGSPMDFVFMYPKNSAALQWLVDNFDIQVELGATRTEYEPYVGGTASPNPDYPQDVQTVTGEQSVWVHGKNLFSFDISTNAQYPNATMLDIVKDSNSITLTSTSTTGAQFGSSVFSGFDSSKTYTISYKAKKIVKGTDGQPGISVVVNGSNDGGSTWSWLPGSGTNNPTQGQEYSFNSTFTGYTMYRFYFYNNNTNPVTVGETTTYYDIQLEEGNATTYEPYQGASYTVRLGSTELCKIGDYQDYIYKSGDDWYVHKEIGKAELDGTESWSVTNSGQSDWFYIANIYSKLESISSPYPFYQWALSDYYTNAYISSNDVQGFNIIAATNVTNIRIREKTEDTTTNFKAWLASNKPLIYAPLVTPTDTKITDATLVGQLEALRGAKTYLNTTIVDVSAAGTNLPAILDMVVATKSLASILAMLDVFTNNEWNALWA